jgi:hypothetical protein
MTFGGSTKSHADLAASALGESWKPALKGVTSSASLACIVVVPLVSSAILIETPIDEPMLRISVQIEAASVRSVACSIAKGKVLSGTKISPRPMP